MPKSAIFRYSEGQQVTVARSAYRNGNGIVPALIGTMPDGDEYAVFSIYIVQQAHLLKPNQTFIKTYSEGEGNLEVLQAAGIVGPILFEVQTGFVTVPAVEVLIEE
jgi:hypothetical protein